jgi:hypothetical protein
MTFIARRLWPLVSRTRESTVVPFETMSSRGQQVQIIIQSDMGKNTAMKVRSGIVGRGKGDIMGNASSRIVTMARWWCIATSVACGLLSPVLRAQAGDSEVGEVSAYAGGHFGPGTHPTVGGSSGMAFAKYALGLIEVGFTPLGNDTLRHRTGVPVESSHLYDFNTSVHIRIPIRERWAPYGIVGGGLLFNSFRAISGPEGPKVAFEEFNAAFHTGAGLRYYVRRDWGIRPEFKVVVSNRTYTRFTVGIFYVLPGGSP